MKGLLDSYNNIVFEAPIIYKGVFDEPTEKWGCFDENENVLFYVMDNDFTLVEFDETKKPSDYEFGKYVFMDGEFVLNPDWTEPPKPIEEVVANHTQSIADLEQKNTELEEQLAIADETAIELYEYQLAQADINNAQDEALIELFEMYGGEP